MNTTKNLPLIIISVLAFLFTLSPSINTEAETNTNTAGQTAEQLYNQGNSSFMQFTPEGFQNAIAYYDKAIQLNPNYAPAYAGLAEVYSFMGLYRYEVKLEYEEYFNKYILHRSGFRNVHIRHVISPPILWYSMRNYFISKSRLNKINFILNNAVLSNAICTPISLVAKWLNRGEVIAAIAKN